MCTCLITSVLVDKICFKKLYHQIVSQTNITFDIKRWLITMGTHVDSADDMLQLPWLFFDFSSKEKAGTRHALQQHNAHHTQSLAHNRHWQQTRKISQYF